MLVQRAVLLGIESSKESQRELLAELLTALREKSLLKEEDLVEGYRSPLRRRRRHRCLFAYRLSPQCSIASVFHCRCRRGWLIGWLVGWLVGWLGGGVAVQFLA